MYILINTNSLEVLAKNESFELLCLRAEKLKLDEFYVMPLEQYGIKHLTRLELIMLVRVNCNEDVSNLAALALKQRVEQMLIAQPTTKIRAKVAPTVTTDFSSSMDSILNSCK